MTIAAESAGDLAAVRDVVNAAFVTQPRVAELVELLRDTGAVLPGLSLVASQAGAVVGHVLVSRAALHGEDGVVRPIATLSPLSVSPSCQRRGIGSQLMRAAIRAVDIVGEPVLVLEGSPRIYGRFGFRPAAELGIRMHVPEWAPPECAMALPLTAWSPAFTGTVEYAPPFAAIEG